MMENIQPLRPILVAQNPCETNRLICEDLSQTGYQTVLVHNLEETLQTYRSSNPLMVIIDICLTGGGLKCCKMLRENGATIPLLLLMSHDTVNDRIACLDAGADDYVLTPYQRETFLHRIRLYLDPHPVEDSGQLEFGDLTLNTTSRSATRNTRNIDLTMKEFDLLKYLMEHPRQTLTRDQILENVWGFDYLGESNVIEVYIRYLRLKTEQNDARRLIHTVRGVGYVLRETT